MERTIGDPNLPIAWHATFGTFWVPTDPFLSMNRSSIDLDPLRADLDAAYHDIAQTVHHDPRQMNALHHAFAWTRTVARVPVDRSTQTILIPSATRRGHVYVVGESCQCEAFRRGIPCWHRAAWLLLRRAWDINARHRLAIAERGIRELYDDPSD